MRKAFSGWALNRQWRTDIVIFGQDYKNETKDISKKLTGINRNNNYLIINKETIKTKDKDDKANAKEQKNEGPDGKTKQT